MSKPRFWEVDLIELAKDWASQLSTFMFTVILFLGLTLPIVIPALIMWAMAGFPSLNIYSYN